MAQSSVCPRNSDIHILLLLFAFCNIPVTTPVSSADIWPLLLLPGAARPRCPRQSSADGWQKGSLKTRAKISSIWY